MSLDDDDRELLRTIAKSLDRIANALEARVTAQPCDEPEPGVHLGVTPRCTLRKGHESNHTDGKIMWWQQQTPLRVFTEGSNK